MPLEKYGNLLDVVNKSSLASSFSQGNTMYGFWKTKMLMLFAAKVKIFSIQQELSKSTIQIIIQNDRPSRFLSIPRYLYKK